MKVGFVFTNFNNTNLTINAIESIAAFNGEFDLKVVVVDNCSDPDDLLPLKLINNDFKFLHLIENTENIGYFRGLNVGLNYLESSGFDSDLVVVGNNDLEFPVDFIDKIQLNLSNLINYPVVCPDIITLDGVHQNPHVISQISKFRILLWDMYYSNYILSLVIRFFAFHTAKFTARRDYKHHESAQLISEGYGACYLLTPLFFRDFKRLWSPTFLMGEEFFLKKQIETKGYRMYYEPSIKVSHHDHATLNKVPSRKLWEISKKAHRVYKQILNDGVTDLYECSNSKS